MSIKAGLRKQNENISHRVGKNINSYKKAKTYYPEFKEFLQAKKKKTYNPIEKWAKDVNTQFTKMRKP